MADAGGARSAARFGIGLILASALTYQVAELVPQADPAAAARVPAGFIAVSSQEAAATPLRPAPQNQVIQLASFTKDAPPPAGVAASWWMAAEPPRVPPITQFDFGPTHAASSVMAAGAMLARLGYGVVTTGAQLRSLVPNPGVGDSLLDLEAALEAGWHATFHLDLVSRGELRSILTAGGGAVLLVNYGTIPFELRQQPEYSWAHAIYLDAYREGGAPGESGAYYVIDPLGQPWHGYAGQWIAATIVERAAIDVGGGPVVAAWVFAAGIDPAGATQPGAAAATPGELGTRIGDPGPTTPSDIANLVVHDAAHGGLRLALDLGACEARPASNACPTGVPAEVQRPTTPSSSQPPSGGQVPLVMRYADALQPGYERVIFAGPSAVAPTFSFWPADGSLPVLEAVVEPATLDGTSVWLATFPVSPGIFDFVASTNDAGVVSTSDVGSVRIGR